MAKRNVPGVWTYGFYDGWVPNYMFFIAHTKNAVGRFYEVQSYGPDIVENLRMGANATSREWYRPNPPLPLIKWGPRNNTNIQQSALLIALNYVAKNRDTFPRELLDQEPARRKSRQDRSTVRVGDSGRAAAQGRGGRARERAAPSGSRDLAGDIRVQGRQRRRGRRRLRHPSGPALPDDGGDVFQPAELRARNPSRTTTPAGPCSSCGT